MKVFCERKPLNYLTSTNSNTNLNLEFKRFNVLNGAREHLSNLSLVNADKLKSDWTLLLIGGGYMQTALLYG